MPDEETPQKGSSREGEKGKRASAKRRSFSDRLPSARHVEFMLCGLLVILALLFPLWWYFGEHGVLDNGPYAVSVTLGGFGLAGMWLTIPPRHR
jgi:hypothetical protein